MVGFFSSDSDVEENTTFNQSDDDVNTDRRIVFQGQGGGTVIGDGATTVDPFVGAALPSFFEALTSLSKGAFDTAASATQAAGAAITGGTVQQRTDPKAFLPLAIVIAIVLLLLAILKALFGRKKGS